MTKTDTPTLAQRVPLYASRLSIDYVRPGRAELLAHFGSLGLTGRYWTI